MRKHHLANRPMIKRQGLLVETDKPDNEVTNLLGNIRHKKGNNILEAIISSKSKV